ncbi:hypothetical protein [Methylocucumis oryzae]|uniref:Alpha-L-arabinofuranosidase n=1 Tax=Methylocucumis oryzae TaxID=1632867 RepID=A0A0F3IFG0_9GAMM|nr:hypothetical protein [Methylocucumis oryzae]KJV05268.1 hypothetical protein VZ94_19390 [Methylocucumis oryzae]
MRNLLRFTAVLAVLFSSIAFATDELSACLQHPDSSPKRLNPQLFGVNMLYFNETDGLRAKPNYQSQLTEMGISVLRFPGGVVADNYHWANGKSERSNRRPKGHAGSAKDLSFDEFYVLAQALSAEPTLVLNYLSWLEKDQIEGAYQEASAWVDYANNKQHPHINYWEFGNEVYEYLPEEHVTAKASLYATHYLTLKQKLHAIDKTLKLGAAMPEKLDLTARGDNAPWWASFLTTAGSEVDFLALHYYPGLPVKRFVESGTGIQEWLTKVNDTIKQYANRQIPLHLTEWNIALWDKSGKQQLLERDSIWQGLFVAEALFDFNAQNVQLATFWPLRTEKGAGLLALKQQQTFISGEVFKLLAPLRNSRISNDCKQSGLRVLRLATEHGSAILVINKKPNQTLSLTQLLGKEGRLVSLTQLTGNEHLSHNYHLSAPITPAMASLTNYLLTEPGIYLFKIKDLGVHIGS